MPDPFSGRQIQNFMITERLGNGIYKGRDTVLQRPVKIKIVQKSDDYAVKKMVAMAATLSALNTEAILQIYTTVEDETHYYFILEYFEAPTLHQHLAQGRKFSMEETLQLTIAIAQGLDKGHRLGLVHQNLYPKSILVGANNVVKLLNFGLNLKIGKTGFDLEEVAQTTFEQGTELKVDEESFFYWSPELYNDLPLDARSDIFTLGVVCYHLLTGKYPHEAQSSIGYLNKLASEAPIAPTHYNPAVPAELEKIVIKMLQTKPYARYQTVTQLLDALLQFQNQRGIAFRFPEQQDKGYVAKAFVSMPFRPRFDNVFATIVAACEAQHVQAIRVDNLVEVDNIWYAILREIADAEFLIADFSGDKYDDYANLNVVTEAAHARAIGKPVILICQNPETLLFDWRVHHAIVYNQEPEGLAFLRQSLERKVAACLRLVKELK